MSNPSDRPDDYSSAHDPAEYLEYSRPRRVLHKLYVWIIGFLAEGKFLHGYSAYDARRVHPVELVVNVVGIATLLGLAYWLLFVVPRGIAVLLVGIPVGLLAIRVSMFGSITVTAWVVAAVDDLINQRYGPEWE